MFLFLIDILRLTINDTTVVGPSQPAARILLESVEQTILNITGTVE